MNQIDSRKKLLIAESELNRALLALDWRMMKDEVRVFTGKVRTFSSISSAGLALVGAFKFLRRRRAASNAGKTSWLKTALKTVGAVSALWSAFLPRRGKAAGK